jgi:uncharacterized membrane protein
VKFFTSLKNSASSFLSSYEQKSPATYAAAQQAIGAILITDGLIGIDNPFGGKKRPGIFGALVGILFGVVFIFAAGFFVNLMGINKMTATTTATVVSVGNSQTSGSTDSSNNTNTCPLTVRYTVDRQEYTKQSSVSSSSNCALSTGQNISINYDPANPSSWAYDLKTLGLIFKIFPLFGALAIVSCLVTFLIRLASIIFGWKILRSGRALAATLPPETDLETIKNEIRQNFLGSVFNFGGGQPATAGGPQTVAGPQAVAGDPPIVAGPPTEPPQAGA